MERHEKEAKKWLDDVQETRDWCRESRGCVMRLEKINELSSYNELSRQRKELQV